MTIYHADCRELDVLGNVLVTDPPYGVNIGKPGVGMNARKGNHGLHTDAYGSYEDTYENYLEVVVPTIRRYVEACERAAVFTGPHIWELPKATAIGGIYSPAGSGRHPWGFKTFLPVLLYGQSPNLQGGASHPNTLYSTVHAEDNGHPCPKPIEWMRWVVALSTLPSDVAVDPFMGSGTTLRAAKDLGRRAIGIEIDERYCEIAATRMGQEVIDLEGAA